MCACERESEHKLKYLKGREGQEGSQGETERETEQQTGKEADWEQGREAGICTGRQAGREGLKEGVRGQPGRKGGSRVCSEGDKHGVRLQGEEGGSRVLSEAAGYERDPYGGMDICRTKGRIKRGHVH